MIITETGRFFWRHNEDCLDEIFSGKIILMPRDGIWKFWDWDLAEREILLEIKNE